MGALFQKGVNSMGAVGDFFTAIAAGAAAWSAWISKSQFKNQTDRQKEQERPRPVPLNQELYLSKSKEFVDMPLVFEWKLSPREKQPNSEISDPMSQFSFPLVNTGRTFAIKVKVTYLLENGIDAVNDFENDIANFKIKNPEFKQLGTDTFSFDLQQQKVLHPKGNFIEDSFLVTPLEIRIPLIKSDETERVRIPMYFTVLSNLYIEKHHHSKPKLRITIEYQDEYSEPYTDIYRVEVQMSKPNPNVDRIEYWLDFTKIKPNHKNAHP